jgi:restriction endonuclease Mrr
MKANYMLYYKQGKIAGCEVMTFTDINTLSGQEFEKLVLRLVKEMGFEARTTRATGDGGVDIIALNKQPFLEGKYIIQCKRHTANIGEPALRDLYGTATSERANKGVLVTTSEFTASAINFAKGKQLELIDGRKLKTLLNKYDIINCISKKEETDIKPKIQQTQNYVHPTKRRSERDKLKDEYERNVKTPPRELWGN